MLRFILPAVIFAVAGVIYYVNNDPSTPQFILPGVNALSWVGSSKVAQATVSWQAFIALGGLTTIFMVISMFFKGSRDRRINKDYNAAQKAQSTPANDGGNLIQVDPDHPSNLVK
ncbi:MAG: hypothetical protein ACI9MC_000831 [Kiritimatiellia bacterium]|jgi:hypothetical protein